MNGDSANVQQDELRAAAILEHAAALGHTAAQCTLAYRSTIGRGTIRDERFAAKMYELAVEQSALAQFCLAQCYLEGRGVAQDHAHGLGLLESAAGQGHAEAQFRLGVFLQEGVQLPRDEERARLQFRAAALQGHRAAQQRLGFSHAYCTPSATKAKATTVSSSGALVDEMHNEASCQLANSFESMGGQATAFRKAADRGDAHAQFNLGACYAGLNGMGGLTVDRYQAVQYFRRAAEQGHADAQFVLGRCYADGVGVAKDAQRMIDWLEQAAAQHHADAQFHLGLAFAEGNGVAKNEARAASRFIRGRATRTSAGHFSQRQVPARGGRV